MSAVLHVRNVCSHYAVLEKTTVCLRDISLLLKVTQKQLFAKYVCYLFRLQFANCDEQYMSKAAYNIYAKHCIAKLIVKMCD